MRILQTQESVNPYQSVKSCDGTNPFDITRAIFCKVSGNFILTFHDNTTGEFALTAGVVYEFAIKNSNSANLFLLY
jgi:hypothetical protein